MDIARPRPRFIAVSSAALVVLAATISGCSTGNQQQAPSSTSTTSTTTATTAPSSSPSAPSPTATEKSIDPTGGNLFTPNVTAPGAPTVQPGEHHGLNGNP